MSTEDTKGTDRPTTTLLVVLAWLLVAVPLAYGLYETVLEALQLLA